MFREKYQYPFYFYILTNQNKTVLYCGMTNSLSHRLREHKTKENPKSFTARYNCDCLVYYEGFPYVRDAIRREKEVKKWRREKKEKLISTINPDWNFLEDLEFFDHTGPVKPDSE